MAGDTTNARQWSEADVYVSWNLNAVIPATVATAWGADWHLVGLLDGDDGFTYAQSEDTTDLFAWGGIIVKTSRKNFKQTVSFGALEWNDTTRRLRWPGSHIGEIMVPSVESTMIGCQASRNAGFWRFSRDGADWALAVGGCLHGNDRAEGRVD